MGLLSDAQVKGILVSKDYLVLYGTFDWLWQSPEERIAASCVAVYDRNLESFVSMSPSVWGAGAYAAVWKEYGKSFYVAGQLRGFTSSPGAVLQGIAECNVLSGCTTVGE